MSTFKRVAVKPSRKTLYVPKCGFITLADDFIGTRVSDMHLQRLNRNEAAKKGNVVDVAADAVFRFILEMRYRRRGDQQIYCAAKLMQKIQDWHGHGSVLSRGEILTANQGYGRLAYLRLIQELGINSLFIFLDRLVFCRPSIYRSRLRARRERYRESSRIAEDRHGGKHEARA